LGNPDFYVFYTENIYNTRNAYLLISRILSVLCTENITIL